MNCFSCLYEPSLATLHQSNFQVYLVMQGLTGSYEQIQFPCSQHYSRGKRFQIPELGCIKQCLEDPTNYRLHIRLYPCVTGAESGSTDGAYSNTLAELQGS